LNPKFVHIVTMKILFLTRYGQKGASSRLRTLQYLPWLEEAKIECVFSPLIDDEVLSQKYRRGTYSLLALLIAYRRRIQVLLVRDQFDLIWIEKEALPWFPLWLEQLFLVGKPYVLDFDDAIFHNYDLHSLKLVRFFYGRRIDYLMKGSCLVIAGNQYLACRAQDAGAPWVEIVPTVIDLDRYNPQGAAKSVAVDGLPRVVWIGSPSTAKYLQLIADPLQSLAQRLPFVLRVIGGGAVSIPGVQTEVMEWSEATEVQALQLADVGIMPLEDTPWEQGKCGYKLIQYMACGLPAIGSEASANNDIVVSGQTGMLVRTAQDWLESLEALLGDAALRHRMGAAGRARVEQMYCLQRTGPRLAELLKRAI
jgi:glycosyltransferase involved in cell wall biosynthesis